jgi:hypothetical protein
LYFLTGLSLRCQWTPRTQPAPLLRQKQLLQVGAAASLPDASEQPSAGALII